MSITTVKGEKILDNHAWQTIYKATMDGDLFYHNRINGKVWLSLVSINARLSIWQIFKDNSHRIPWREVNCEDIRIEGFGRTFGALGKNQRVGWFVCYSCGALYTDTQENIALIRDGGCQLATCANHREEQ